MNIIDCLLLFFTVHFLVVSGVLGATYGIFGTGNLPPESNQVPDQTSVRGADAVKEVNLDLLDIDNDYYQIFKSSGPPFGFRITPRPGVTIRTISASRAKIWTVDNSHCQSLTVYEIKNDLLLVIRLVKGQGEAWVHYFLSDNLGALGTLEFLHLLNNSTQSAEDEVSTLNIGNEFNVLFHDALKLDHNGYSLTRFNLKEEEKEYSISRITIDQTIGTDPKSQKEEEVPIWTAKLDHLRPNRVELFKLKGDPLLLIIFLNNFNLYYQLGYGPVGNQLTNGNSRVHQLTTGNRRPIHLEPPRQAGNPRAKREWRQIKETDAEQIIDNHELKRFHHMGPSRFKIDPQTGSIKRANDHQGTLEITKRNAHFEYFTTNIGQIKVVTAVPIDPHLFKGVTYQGIPLGRVSDGSQSFDISVSYAQLPSRIELLELGRIVKNFSRNRNLHLRLDRGAGIWDVVSEKEYYGLLLVELRRENKLKYYNFKGLEGGTEVSQLSESVKALLEGYKGEPISEEVGTDSPIKKELKGESKNELKKELKGESKNESKEELKGESKNELKEELKGESKNELKEELKGESKNELKEELKKELKVSKKNWLRARMRRLREKAVKRLRRMRAAFSRAILRSKRRY